MGESFLYFAYGSNMLKQRLLLHAASAEFVDIATLQDYCLAFDISGDGDLKRVWHGAAATIHPSQGECMWGVVWRISMADSDNLDRQESFAYKRIEVKVTTKNDTCYTCRTYKINGVYNLTKLPSPHYKDVILRGARQWGLPRTYVDKLAAIEDNGYVGDDPLYDSLVDKS